MSVGRPSSFTEAIVETICARMAEGQSLRQICRDPQMPDRVTVMRWLRDKTEFRSQYAQAREDLLEFWSDQIVDIADGETTTEAEGDKPVQPSDVNRDRLRVDTRKWLMSKLGAKKYGERQTTEVTGKDGGPIETANLSDKAAAQLLWSMMTAAAKKPEDDGKPQPIG